MNTSRAPWWRNFQSTAPGMRQDEPPCFRLLPSGREVYDTGKVQIGSRYQESDYAMRDQGVHADNVQSVMLERRHTFTEPRLRMPWGERLYWVLAVCTIVALIWQWLAS